MKFGIIKFVVHTQKGYYGFLMTPEGDVYFQGTDYQPFMVDVDKDIVTMFGIGHCPVTPKQGDTLYYVDGEDKAGRRKAGAWCTEEEGERVAAILEKNEKFKIVRTTTRGKVVLWEGYDEALMYLETELKKPLEKNNGYVNGVYTSYSFVNVHEHETVSN